MPHRAVIFDLGKTLVHFDFRRGYQALEPHCPYPAAEIPKRLAATGLVERFECGLVEPRDFVERIAQALDLRCGYDGFCEIWSSIFTHTLVPESMLEGLRARGYRLLLLSNTNALHFDMLRIAYQPLLRHFDDLILSYEVHAMKPQPAIYEAALARAACRPEECFYTDDIPEYIAGARALGIDAVQFRDAGQLAQELTARGIAWE
ncbi:MAG TPA: HAD family phosphatase [Bryobacteraceae bacterium]|nr:HAD family phosphatase [Bryobacteraceae bacterium]